jgi:NADH:ubiquinone oxidoreductase subunit 3 (subunit A)
VSDLLRSYLTAGVFLVVAVALVAAIMGLALLFVLFDVEAVFIFPFATRAEAYGWFGFVEMAIFIVVLALGLLYAWKKKVLRWI